MIPDYIPLNWNDSRSAPLMQFEFGKRSFLVQSESCPEVVFHLHILKNGKAYCTCEDFRFRGAKEHKPCKHLRSLNFQKHIIEVSK